jgi:serine/threonine protein kinase
MSSARQIIKIDETLFSLDTFLDNGIYGKIFHGTNLDTNEAVAIKKFEFDRNKFEVLKVRTIAGVHATFAESIAPIKKSLAELHQQLAKESSPAIQADIETLEAKLERGNTFLPGHIEKAVRIFLQTQLDAMREGALHEAAMLKLVDDGIGNVSVQEVSSDPTDTVYYLAMKLAPGKKVTDLLGMQEGTERSINPLHPDVLFDLGLKLGLSLLRVQAKGVVLRDLHFNNVMYDLETQKLTLVDYGDALKLTHDSAVGDAMGSEPFMALEILDALDSRRASAANMEYSEKTTVFSYGAMLASLFDLADIQYSNFLKCDNVRFKTILLRDSDTLASKLDDREIRQKMLCLIEDMTTKNPARRISLKQATERLYDLASTYKATHTTPSEHPQKKAKLTSVKLSQSSHVLFKHDSEKTELQIPTFPTLIAPSPPPIITPSIPSTDLITTAHRVGKRAR